MVYKVLYVLLLGVLSELVTYLSSFGSWCSGHFGLLAVPAVFLRRCLFDLVLYFLSVLKCYLPVRSSLSFQFKFYLFPYSFLALVSFPLWYLLKPI